MTTINFVVTDINEQEDGMIMVVMRADAGYPAMVSVLIYSEAAKGLCIGNRFVLEARAEP